MLSLTPPESAKVKLRPFPLKESPKLCLVPDTARLASGLVHPCVLVVHNPASKKEGAEMKAIALIRGLAKDEDGAALSAATSKRPGDSR
jgi:hypothetical protein